MRIETSCRNVLSLLVVVAAFAVTGCNSVESAFDLVFPGGSASTDAKTEGKSEGAATNAQTPPDNGPYAASASCKTCHTTIYEQWSQSMHANALKGPLVVAQTNADMQLSLKKAPSEEAKGICVNCHGPVAGLTAAPGASLPLAGGDERANEGISCVACHSSADGASTPGGGALKSAFGAKIEKGRRYYGPIDQAAGNGFHVSVASPAFKTPDNLCGSCHDVNFDRNGDGQIVKGTDLVLQTTFDEYGDYRAAGGNQSCADCHMPVVGGVTSIAPGAPGSAPPRQLHDHSFVGVDQRFDLPGDPQAAKREALLASSAALSFASLPTFDGTTISLRVSITNQSGHNLPTGFAFARQMWLEVAATGPGGVTTFASGVLAKPSDDLCDSDTMTDALAGDVQGCATVDTNLVNLQQKLVDRVTAGPPFQKDLTGATADIKLLPDVGASETPFQFFEGGPVARKRPSTGEALGTIPPRQSRVFSYTAPVTTPFAPGTGTLRVRLLFRALPPYFLRALDRRGNVGSNVAALADQLKIVEIASLSSPL